MIIHRIQARQLGNPNRLFGKIFAPIWNRRNAALNNMVFEKLELQPDDRILEVGFGGGYLMNRMASVVSDGFLAGVDISQTMVISVKKRFRHLIAAGKLDLQCARAEILPFTAENFTKACSVNSIFYWENAPLALSELWRVLRNHGKIVLCHTCTESLEKMGFANYVARYKDQEICSMLEIAGFQKIEITNAVDKYRKFSCLTGLKLISV